MKAYSFQAAGGLFAIHAMVTRPDLVNAYIAVSPSLQWDNQVKLKRVEEFFKNRKELKKTLFFSLGNEPGDISTSFNRFKEIVAQYQPKDFEWLASQMPDEDHGSVVLRSHYQGLRKVFEDWQLPTDAGTGAIIGGWPSVEPHYKRLSQKYGYTILPSEALVNQYGYQLMGAGKMEEAIAVFKANGNAILILQTFMTAWLKHMRTATDWTSRVSTTKRRTRSPKSATIPTLR